MTVAGGKVVLGVVVVVVGGRSGGCVEVTGDVLVVLGVVVVVVGDGSAVVRGVAVGGTSGTIVEAT